MKKNYSNSKQSRRDKKQAGMVVPDKSITSGYSIGRLAGRRPAIPLKTSIRFNQVFEGFFAAANASQAYLVGFPGNGLFQVGGGNSNAVNTQLYYKYTAMTGSTALGSALPPNYATLVAMYKQYRVVRSSIKVTVLPINANDQVQLAVWPATEESSVVSGYVGTVGAVYPAGSVAAQMVFGDTSICSTYADPNSKSGNTIALSMSTAEINGLTKSQYDNDVVNGVLTANNPVISAGNQDLDLPWNWWVSLGEITNANFTSNLIVKYELEYDAVLFDPQSITA